MWRLALPSIDFRALGRRPYFFLRAKHVKLVCSVLASVVLAFSRGDDLLNAYSVTTLLFKQAKLVQRVDDGLFLARLAVKDDFRINVPLSRLFGSLVLLL